MKTGGQYAVDWSAKRGSSCFSSLASLVTLPFPTSRKHNGLLKSLVGKKREQKSGFCEAPPGALLSLLSLTFAWEPAWRLWLVTGFSLTKRYPSGRARENFDSPRQNFQKSDPNRSLEFNVNLRKSGFPLKKKK